MKKVILGFIIAFLLFLPSCSSDNGLDALYESEDWQTLYERCETILSHGLEEDALYYRMISLYRLGSYDESQESALLYCLMYNETGSARTANALRILLIYCPDAQIRVDAGRELTSGPSSTTSDLIYFFTALMECGSYDEAAQVYNELRPQISGRSAALMCLHAGSSSTLIVSNFESWFSESGTSDEFRTSLINASGLLLSRGEGQLILPLLVRVQDGNDGLLNLILGDIYAQMGDPVSARTYYNKATAEYPSAVAQRLIALRG